MVDLDVQKLRKQMAELKKKIDGVDLQATVAPIVARYIQRVLAERERTVH